MLSKSIESRKYRDERHDAVKKYANPIIFASEQLAWRLKEILNFDGAYLLPEAPKNGFYKYKFDSTVYRLCALLGWIQAAQKEQSYINGFKIKHHRIVQSAITELHKRLADGSHVEVSILDHLALIFRLDNRLIVDKERASIGVQIENIIFKYIPDSVKKNVANLNEHKQVELL